MSKHQEGRERVKGQKRLAIMHKLDGVQEQGAKQKAAAAVVLPEDGVRAGRDNREI